jgi:hypothetical protein
MISSSVNKTAARGVLKAAASAAGRHERLHLFRFESQIPRNHRSDSRAHLHGRPLAPQRNAAGKRGGTAEELPKRGSKPDAPVVDEERVLGLRDSAASREREVAPQQIARSERPERGDQNPPPARSSRRIHAGRESPGEQDERHDHQADQSA